MPDWRAARRKGKFDPNPSQPPEPLRPPDMRRRCGRQECARTPGIPEKIAATVTVAHGVAMGVEQCKAGFEGRNIVPLGAAGQRPVYGSLPWVPPDRGRCTRKIEVNIDLACPLQISMGDILLQCPDVPSSLGLFAVPKLVVFTDKRLPITLLARG